MKKTLMTHLVYGYPSIKESQDLLEILSKYSKYIEIQIPFSDPIADGPIISNANEVALENGITPSACFDFLERFMINSESEQSSHTGSPHFVRDDKDKNHFSVIASATKQSSEISSKILIMTYYNIVYNYGVEKFVEKAKKIGIYGLIIPDMPFDEIEGKELIKLCRKYDINLIQVVSPTCEKSRLKKIFSLSSGFVYAVSQNMTTGNKISFGKDFEDYIRDLKKLKNIEIGVGFGVKTLEDINEVCKVADFAIIGSELIRIINQDGTSGVRKYFENMHKEKEIA